MSAPWLIATDLDGTLIDHSLEIRPATRAALEAARAAGHLVTLATGRMLQSTLPFARRLEIELPLICYQGALVADDRRVYFHRTLPLEVARDAIRLARERKIHLNVYLDDRLFVAERTPEAEFYATLAGGQLEIEVVGDLEEFLDREPTKLVFVQDEPETGRFSREAAALWSARAQVVRSHPRYVELTHPAVSKGEALRRLATTLDVPLNRTLAIGDNHNDIALLRGAAIGIAMGDAPDEVRAAADRVAPRYDDDGWAHAVEQFLREQIE